MNIIDVATMPAILKTTQIPGANGESGRKSATDFSTFLTLLTTQMKNQDPLKPLKSTDFIAQLASFSSVEQQVRTNTSLAAIQKLLGGGSNTGLASWIGLDVRAKRNFNFSGTPVDLYISPAKQADRAELVVRDASGKEVQRQAVPIADNVMTWAGVRADNSPLANGTYSFSLESFRGSKMIGSKTVPVYAKVVEARIDGDKTMLVLSDGAILQSDLVTAVRGSQPAMP